MASQVLLRKPREQGWGGEGEGVPCGWQQGEEGAVVEPDRACSRGGEEGEGEWSEKVEKSSMKESQGRMASWREKLGEGE